MLNFQAEAACGRVNSFEKKMTSEVEQGRCPHCDVNLDVAPDQYGDHVKNFHRFTESRICCLWHPACKAEFFPAMLKNIQRHVVNCTARGTTPDDVVTESRIPHQMLQRANDAVPIGVFVDLPRPLATNPEVPVALNEDIPPAEPFKQAPSASNDSGHLAAVEGKQ